MKTFSYEPIYLGDSYKLAAARLYYHGKLVAIIENHRKLPNKQFRAMLNDLSKVEIKP